MVYLYDLVIQNRELFRIISTLIIGLCCLIIVLKTDKLFKLSTHQGIRYFRNAFFFYGLAFVLRYFMGSTYFFNSSLQSIIANIVFEFFLMMAGFSLLYSLVWRRFEGDKQSFSSLFNLKILLFYALAAVISALDLLIGMYLFMFLTQIGLFIYASGVGYVNYQKNRKEGGFASLYFIIILLNLIGWVANSIIAFFLNWNQIGVILTSALNIIIFLLFLYCVVGATRIK